MSNWLKLADMPLEVGGGTAIEAYNAAPWTCRPALCKRFTLSARSGSFQGAWLHEYRKVVWDNRKAARPPPSPIPGQEGGLFLNKPKGALKTPECAWKGRVCEQGFLLDSDMDSRQFSPTLIHFEKIQANADHQIGVLRKGCYFFHRFPLRCRQ